MNIGILLPGFSAHTDDWAIPVQQHLMRELGQLAEVRIIALRYPHTHTPYVMDGSMVYPLGYGAWSRGWRRLALWRTALNRITELHRQQPFDLLHAMWADETGLIASRAGKRLGIPVVVSVAGGELARLDDIGYGLARSAFGRWTVSQALHGADAIVVASQYNRGLLETAHPEINRSHIHTISLGVDATLFHPDDITPRNPRRLIHAASLVPVKDQATLLRALARLNDVSLEIIGDGPERDRLHALAHELGITNRVTFSGAVPHVDMPARYRSAALHVLTSRHEGQGMVTLEAAACGLPTVSTAVGMVPDHSALGITVPVGDDTALAAAIAGLLDNLERLAELGRSARERVESRFTIAHTAKQFIALYQSLLA